MAEGFSLVPMAEDGTLARPITETTFNDITPKAVESVEVTDSEVKIVFAEELTPDERQAAIRRVVSTSEQEQLERQAKTAVADINAYLALAAPTNAQVAAEVKLLSRAVKKLILMVVPDSNDNAPGA
jgi:hypothetical protein